MQQRDTHDALQSAVVERAVDGDTLIVVTDAGERTRVRLIGIDAPESVAPDKERNCEEGRISSAWVHKHVPHGTHVWLQSDVADEDEYGRKLRYVWIDNPKDPESTREICNKMLNALLIKDGYASARSYPPNTLCDYLFQSLEESRTPERLL